MKVYRIPKNYATEDRAVNGMFRTRYLAEGVIYALIFAVPTWMLCGSGMSFNTKLTISALVAAPFLVVGLVGINDRPVSVYIKLMIEWQKNRSLKLSDNSRRVLAASPLDTMMSQPVMKDRMMDIMEARQNKKLAKRLGKKLIPGETFEFEKSSDFTYEYLTPEDLESRAAAYEPEEEDVELVMDENDIPETELEDIPVLASQKGELQMDDFFGANRHSVPDKEGAAGEQEKTSNAAEPEEEPISLDAGGSEKNNGGWFDV